MMGKNAVLACTAAVEGTVHHHMNEQIEYLSSRDLELKNYVENVRDEEFGHLKFAEDNLLTKNLFTKIIEKVVINSTEAIIWLSTWGAVQRMRQEFAK